MHTFNFLLLLCNLSPPIVCANQDPITYYSEIFISYKISVVCNTNKLCQETEIHSTIPRLILTTSKLNHLPQSIIKSPLTIAIGFDLSSSHLISILSGKQLMSRNPKPSKTSPIPSNCLLIPRDIFTNRLKISTLDDYISRIQSILLDQYKWYPKGVFRFNNIKNRHIMVIKVLVDHHNLTVGNCEKHQVSDNPNVWDIDLAVYTYPQKLLRLSQNYELIHSREKFEVKFGAVKRYNVVAIFLALFRPIGFNMFMANIMVIGCLTICVIGYRKISGIISDNPCSATLRVSEFLIRAQIDQCLGYKHAALILKTNINLRFIYATYLFYCLLISATFKSNLIQELMKPTETLSPETFHELLADKRPIHALETRKGGQPMHVNVALESELGRGKRSDNTIFENLSNKYILKAVKDVNELLQCKVSIMDEGSYHKIMFEILEKKYRLRGYKIAEDSIANDIFWAVKHSAGSTGLVETLNAMASAGIIDYFR